MKKPASPFISLFSNGLSITTRRVLLGSVAALSVAPSAQADLFDLNSTANGFGVADSAVYDWHGANLWAGTPNDSGTAATATWVNGSRQAYFVGAGTGTNYTVRLGAAGSTATTLQNLAINVNSAANGALAGAAGSVTIGNVGDTGILTLNAANSVGAQGGGTLTINNGVNLNAKTLNFRGGNVIVNGVVSGTTISKIAFGSGAFGLSAGTLTLANTANTYAGRVNSDFISTGYTLAVTKLANGGSNSSIGTSSANIGINGGTVRYVGGTGAQSTTLGLHIGSAHAFVDASGVTSSDTISISGAPTFSAANQTGNVTLTGANLGDNTMAFVFNNNGTGVNILNKTGAGRWVVNQANAYTGGTNANGGTLVAANVGAFGVAGRTITFNSGAVEFATDTTANAYVLNVGSGNSGTVVVNRANSAATMTHTMGTATIGNSTLSFQKGANVTGVGTLEFGGINMTAGATGLSTGTMLNPTTANVLVSGNVTRTGSLANLLTLDGTSTGNLISGIISGSQALTKSNSGTWELSNANTFTGNTKVTGGTLKLTHNLALQNSTFDTSGAGTLDVTTTNTPTFGGLTSATDFALPANVTGLTLNQGSGTQTFTGNLSGGAAGLTLTKTGAGTQILGGTNSYGGDTIVNGGELRITTASAIGGNSVTVTSGQIALTGGITIPITKSLTTSGSGNNFFGGLQSVSGSNEWQGSILLGSDLSRLGPRKNATLILSGPIDDGVNSFGVVLRNESFGTGTNGAGNANTLTILSGVSTYGGVTQFIGGLTKLDGGDNRLPLGTVLNFGAATVNAKFDLNGRSQEIAGLAVTSTGTDVNRDWNANELTNSSGNLSTLTVNTLTNQSFGVSQANNTGIITGNIALVKSGAGTLNLSGNNTYSGGTAINAGTATAGHVSAFGTGVITLASGATIDLGGLALTNDIVNLGGTITGATNYAPTVAQTLSGTSSYSGTVGGAFNVASGGTLKGNATTFSGAVTVESGGIHSPGASPGLQTFSAGITYDNGSTLVWEFAGDGLAIRGNAGGGDYDAVDVTGGNLSIAAGAKLKVVNFSAVDYSATDWDSVRSFTIVDSSGGGTTSGNFTLDPTGDITIGGQGVWTVGTTSGLNGDTLLTWTPVPEPSTYAALAGLAALGLAWKRRRTK